MVGYIYDDDDDVDDDVLIFQGHFESIRDVLGLSAVLMIPGIDHGMWCCA